MLTERVRRVRTVKMSWYAAPVGLVTTPTRFGSIGSLRLRSTANKPSFSSFDLICSNATRKAPSPTGSSDSTDNWYSPRGSYTVSFPRTRTVKPFEGLNLIFQFVLLKQQALICAPSPFNEKYQCPDLAPVKFVISPSTQISAKPRSISRLTCAFNSATVSGRRSCSSKRDCKSDGWVRRDLNLLIRKLHKSIVSLYLYPQTRL